MVEEELESIKKKVFDLSNTINNISSELRDENYCVKEQLDRFKFRYYLEKENANKTIYELEMKLKELKTKVNEEFNPLVSIIIPVYNGSNYLEEAINCALNQTYKNIEIIVINDGSNDNNATKKIAKKYKHKVKYYEKKNGGVSSALNTGIKKMKGDYFMWLSHDDLVSPNHILEHIKYLRTSDGGEITYTNYDYIDSSGNLLLDMTIDCNLFSTDYNITRNKKYDCILLGDINGGSLLIPKEAFNKVGLFNESERITQEKDLYYRLLKEYKLVNIPINTYSIRHHESQVSNKSTNIIEETIKKLEEIIDNLKTEDIKEDYKNIESFYTIMSQQYRYNGLLELSDYLVEKRKDL